MGRDSGGSALLFAVAALALVSSCREGSSPPLKDVAADPGPVVATTAGDAAATTNSLDVVFPTTRPDTRVPETASHESAAPANSVDASRDAREGPEIRVRVLDADSRPAGDVPVVLARQNKSIKSFASATTDAQTGEVSLRMPAEARATLRPRDRWCVTVALPIDPAPEVQINPLAPPGEPIVLVLGPTGRVVVRLVDYRGDLVTEPTDVSLAPCLDPFGNRSGTFRRRLAMESPTRTTTGVARFNRVGVGGQVLPTAIVVGRQPGSSSATDGPSRAGAEITIPVEVSISKPLATGRLVDAESRPISNELIAVTVLPGAMAESENYEFEEFRETDSGGFFRTELHDRVSEGRPRHLEIRRRLTDFDVDVTSVASIDLGDDVFNESRDFGDVRLLPTARGRPTLAGTVVDATGAALPFAWITLVEEKPQRSRARSSMLELRTKARQDGRFEFHDVLPHVALRISAEGPKHSRSEPATVEAGQLDVTVRVLLEEPREGAIKGAVEKDGVLPPTAVRASLSRDLPDGTVDVVASVHPRSDGKFQFLGMPRDTYSVTFTDADGALQPTKISGVKVAQDDDEDDPRLEGIKLAIRPGFCVVQVVDDHYRDVDHAVAAPLACDLVGSDAREAIVKSAHHRLVIAPGTRGRDYLIGGAGVQSQRVSVTDGFQIITLSPGLPIYVSVTKDTGPGYGASILARFDDGADSDATRRPADLVGSRCTAKIDATVHAAEVRVSKPGRWIIEWHDQPPEAAEFKVIATGVVDVRADQAPSINLAPSQAGPK